MIRGDFDLVIVFGCVLLVVLGCLIGAGVGYQAEQAGVINLSFSMLGNLGGFLAGVAAICAIGIWKRQITLPREYDVLDEMCVANYEVREALFKAVIASLLYSNADSTNKYQRMQETLTAKTLRNSIFISDLQFPRGPLEDHRSSLISAENVLESAIQKYSALFDKSQVYCISGLVSGDELRNDCRLLLKRVETFFKFPYKNPDQGILKAQREELLDSALLIFNKVRSPLLGKYAAG